MLSAKTTKHTSWRSRSGREMSQPPYSTDARNVQLDGGMTSVVVAQTVYRLGAIRLSCVESVNMLTLLSVRHAALWSKPIKCCKAVDESCSLGWRLVSTAATLFIIARLRTDTIAATISFQHRGATNAYNSMVQLTQSICQWGTCNCSMRFQQPSFVEETMLELEPRFTQ